MHKETSYKVIGSRHFPFDMLRYDQACPADGRSAEELGQCNMCEITQMGKPLGERTITLNAKRCTPERWASFGWHVIKDSICNVAS